MKVGLIYLICAAIGVASFFYFNRDLVLSHRADQAYQHADYKQAALDYLAAIQHGYQTPEGLLQFVEALSKSGLLESSTEPCLKLISSGMLSPSALFSLAGAFEAIQDWDMAATTYDRLIETGNATDAVLLKRAHVAGYAGNWNASIYYLRQLLGDDS
jgi:tetratricopeptide (TPR) repeat protein